MKTQTSVATTSTPTLRRVAVAKFLSVAFIFSVAFIINPLAPRDAFARQGPARARKPETLTLMGGYTQRGKESLEAGDTEDAEKWLRQALKQNESDSAAWHYLGLALARQSKTKEARAALLRAVDLRINAFNKELTAQRTREGELSREQGEQLRLRFADVTKELAESVESFLSVAHEDEEFWGEALTMLEAYTRLAADPKFANETFDLARLATRINITHKSEPEYTEEARQYGVSGRIVVRVLFGADGTIRGVTVAKGLPHGLTENAIRVARRIEFKPAMLDNRPVAQLFFVEYNFYLY